MFGIDSNEVDEKTASTDERFLIRAFKEIFILINSTVYTGRLTAMSVLCSVSVLFEAFLPMVHK